MSVPSYADRQAQLERLRAALVSADRPADKLIAATSLLNVVGQLAVLAPTEVLRARWMAHYRELQPQAAALRASQTADPPAAWLQQLAQFSDRVLGVVDAVVGGVEGIAAGAGGLARALPLIVIVILIVIAIGFFKGSLRARIP